MGTSIFNDAPPLAMNMPAASAVARNSERVISVPVLDTRGILGRGRCAGIVPAPGLIAGATRHGTWPALAPDAPADDLPACAILATIAA